MNPLHPVLQSLIQSSRNAEPEGAAPAEISPGFISRVAARGIDLRSRTSVSRLPSLAWRAMAAAAAAAIVSLVALRAFAPSSPSPYDVSVPLSNLFSSITP